MRRIQSFLLFPLLAAAFCGCGVSRSSLAHKEVVEKWGFIDKRGRVVIPARFDRADGFSQGLAPVARGSRWGYIDRNGRMVIRPRFQSGDVFSEGLAAVGVGDKTGFIDKRGIVVITPKNDEARPFCGGLAAVFVGGKRGYIDKRGQTVIKPRFDHASCGDDYLWEFSEGRAPFVVRGLVTRLGPDTGGG